MNILVKNLDQLASIYCPPETKKKLIDATISCVKRWGIEKTSLNDIAREAGCARQTVYNYYKNKDDLILVALIEATARYSENMVNHIRQFATPAERMLEAMMYCITQIPQEPYLQFITDTTFSPLLNPEVFNSDMCVGLISHCAAICLENTPNELQTSADEIGEAMTRIVLSLITIQGPKKRSENELREYINKRFVPGLIA